MFPLSQIIPRRLLILAAAAPIAAPGVAEEPAAPPTPSLEQPVIWADADHYSPKTQHLLRTLDAPLQEPFEFEDVELGQFAEYLANVYEIEVLLDLPALDELAITPEEPLSTRIKNVTLRNALERALDQLELTAVVANEVLLITTEEEADTRLETAVYQVGDISNCQNRVGCPPMGASAYASFDQLIDVIVSTVASETWAENGGGEAEIRPLGLGLLVVSQTAAVHEKIRATLTAIRQARNWPRDEGPASQPVTEGQLTTSSYRLGLVGEENAEQRAEVLWMVNQVIGEFRGDEEKPKWAFAEIVGERLIIRDLPAIQQAAATFLTRSGLHQPAPGARGCRGGVFGGGGGGGGGVFAPADDPPAGE